MARESTFVNMSVTLFAVCLIASAVLGGVYALTKEPIDAAQIAKINGAIGGVVPEFDNAPSAEMFTVEVDGKRAATVAYPPYAADIGVLAPGKHTVTVNAYISRRNCFGDVHNADEKFSWQGPSAWVQNDHNWTYEYRLRRTGVISTPLLYKK